MEVIERARTVLAGLDQVRSWQEELYRDLHSHPELSHQEHRTAGEVAQRLRSMGYTVHDGVGGTGVVGVLQNGPSDGSGRGVLLRADMDALPVAEQTGLPYASAQTATDADGHEVGVMHACGHDSHVVCLLGAAQLLADHRDAWSGTVVALFQPAEEVGDGARGMTDDGLASLLPHVDVALGQHVLPARSGTVGTNAGPTLSQAESMRITVHGRGGHGSMPHTTIDPVVLAAMIVVRLQTVVAREVDPGELAVLTVGSVRAGAKSNVISDRAVLQLNIRSYSDEVHRRIVAAVHRIVEAECQASDSPRPPEFESYDVFPLTDNDPTVTGQLADAFTAYFGERHHQMGRWAASEDFSDIPTALEVPYAYWGFGGIDPDAYDAAETAGRIHEDVPGNHSPHFAPVIQPTLDTGTEALVVATLRALAG